MSKSSNDKDRKVNLTGKRAGKLLGLLGPDYKAIIRAGVDEHIANGIRFMLEILMQAEVQVRCGGWYERKEEDENKRWGSEKGTAIACGQKTDVSRPRIRTGKNGQEVQLETYKAMNERELLDEKLMASILAGVSTRRYATTLATKLGRNGVSKSAVSRRTIAKTKPMVEQFLKKDLKEHDLAVLMFDGIHVAKRQMIVCVGIDMSGKKHVLGMHVGATENEIVCRDLLRDMIGRGLNAQQRYLFVVDGSKALVGAIRAAFGQNVHVQRCQEHKIRDVQAYLPVKMRSGMRAKLQAAYSQRTEKEASKRLEKIRFELLRVSENAANSLVEGLNETLTVHRLGITGLLRQSLRTTNIMESAFSSVRRYMGRVTHFEDEAQIELWITRSILEAERHFRSIRGVRQLTKLRDELTKTKK
jgi:transposase-like protein